MKMSAPMEGASAEQFMLYAELCGRTLARAHAESGDAALISGYLVAAVKAGRIKALVEEET